MKKLISILIMCLYFVVTNQTWASEPEKETFDSKSFFEIRADGLACPYCAYGIEKKFMAIKGVHYVDVDLKKGLVKVNGIKSLKFSEEQLKKLFTDSGFTYKSMRKVESVNSNVAPVAQEKNVNSL